MRLWGVHPALRPGTRQQGREAAGWQGTRHLRHCVNTSWSLLCAGAHADTGSSLSVGVTGHAGLWPPASTRAAESLHGAKVCKGVLKGIAITSLPDASQCVAMRGMAGAYPDPVFLV